MKVAPPPRCLIVCLLLLACAGVCAAAPPVTLRPTPKTVADYFLLLPNKYFEWYSLAQRRAWLADKSTVLDIKNDYLYAHGDGAQGGLCVVLFRHAGRVVVAVQSEGYDPPEPTVDFLRFEHGRWTNVTKQVLDADDAGDFDPCLRNTVQLPRHGTTIHVLNSVGVQQYDLLWKNGRFVKANDKG